MLGVDTAYVRDVKDSELVRISRSENRTILTRDRRLPLDFPHNDCLILNANDTEGQLCELMTVLPEIFLPARRSRCTACNGQTRAIERGQALNRVPEYVFLSARDFSECESCKKVYWEGSHGKNFFRKINGLLGGKDCDKLTGKRKQIPGERQ